MLFMEKYVSQKEVIDYFCPSLRRLQKTMRITVLGSGTSTGVPQVGCRCEVCTSKDFRDKRLRTSGLVETDGVRLLIDCGPDFREQSLRMKDFGPLDAVVITHEHYDHVGGLDDLRPFCQFGDVPVYAENVTLEALRVRMPYCFKEHLYPGVPHIPLRDISPGKAFTVSGRNGKSVEVMPLRVVHGRMPIIGFRIGNMAWITDMTTMPDETFSMLQGLDVLVMNALRIKPHWTHQSLSEALERAKMINAKETYLVHISHQMGLHEEVDSSLPEHVHLAYDGLELNI